YRAYQRAGEIDGRAVRWAAPAGAAAAALGAWTTAAVNPHALLLVTAILIAWQAIRVGFGRTASLAGAQPSPASPQALIATGLAAGFASGLLGIGGGVILVPVMHGVLHMPLKRTIGTSLVVIAFMVVPGTVVHALLGHINWAIFAWLTIGVIPGAAIGSRWTIRAGERTLRLAVGTFLILVAIAYGALEVHQLLA
ncbi:MAG TPA: sulfite exporter TauE/SafE family protein, partial [Actinomycetota bacterium]|nr:sulfite exporter TauE/SafE family protein [Actinomycetota bacterium]